jgi:hypothetical protein
VQAFDVLAGGDQELAGGLGADAEEPGGAGCGRRDELLELLIKLVDLPVEVLDAVGEAAEGELGGLGWFVDAPEIGAQP